MMSSSATSSSPAPTRSSPAIPPVIFQDSVRVFPNASIGHPPTETLFPCFHFPDSHDHELFDESEESDGDLIEPHRKDLEKLSRQLQKDLLETMQEQASKKSTGAQLDASVDSMDGSDSESVEVLRPSRKSARKRRQRDDEGQAAYYCTPVKTKDGNVYDILLNEWCKRTRSVPIWTIGRINPETGALEYALSRKDPGENVLVTLDWSDTPTGALSKQGFNTSNVYSSWKVPSSIKRRRKKKCVE